MALSGDRPFHEKRAVDLLRRADIAWRHAASTNSCRQAIRGLVEVARSARAAREHLTAIGGFPEVGQRSRRGKLLAHADKIKRQVDEALLFTPCLSRNVD